MDSSVLLTGVAAIIGFFALFKKLQFHQENKDEDSFSSSTPPPSSPISSLPLSSFSRNWIHDVFPSFRGEDVRRDFLSHIQKEFQRKGITPFIDNEIKRGESIGYELKKAIRESKIAVILFSRNYASSSWCLEELVEIMKCRQELGQTVIAVFYKVDPSHIKKLTGDFGKIFRKTCKGKTKNVIGRWRQALTEVATVAGYHSINWENDATMIENIASDISNILNKSPPSRDLDTLVLTRAHMENMETLLCLGSNEVRMIGIWGPSGIGKTTIARYLLSQYSHQFQLSTIMVNIRRCYPRPCFDEASAKLQLQNQLLSQIMNHKDTKISHLGVAQERLKNKKVFIVLDDVGSVGQLDALAQETFWFGPGSRIIITTEDLRVLKAHGINHIYKLDFPPPDEALQIFCLHAFRQTSPKQGFESLSWEATNLAGKLPLGLRVMGSHFRGMSKQEWTKALPRLRTRLDADIQSILQFGYDALHDEDKSLFLYIACFFNHQKLDRVREHLKNKFRDVMEGLNVLSDKSLVSIHYGNIEMHNLLAKLGREIVCKQPISELGHRQFLVDAREIYEILIDDGMGSKSIACIDFNLNEVNEELNISERAFEGMPGLRFLRFNVHRHMIHLSHGLSCLSQKLRLLEWNHFPMTCLPYIVNTESLVEINMCFSKLEKLWEGTRPLTNLKWMDLSSSINLKELPDLSTATKLQELNLGYCSRLVDLPYSIGNATDLKELNLRYCSSLVELPYSIGNATNLLELNLCGCSSLVKLPSSIGNAVNLRILSLIQCSSLMELPSSIGNASNLQKINLSQCSSLVELPSSIGNVTNLEQLDLSDCSSLVGLPKSIGSAFNLRELNLNRCSRLVKLPSSVGNATNLKELSLNQCSSLVELPSSIGNATHLKILDLSYCSALLELPSSIGNATNLMDLNLGGCSRLVELPSSIGNAINLVRLTLHKCSSLLELPFSIGDATNLCHLDLGECSSLMELPSSIGKLDNLLTLNLRGCSKLETLPINNNLKSLKELDLTYCSLLKSFPEISKNIKYLNLSGTAIKEVPSSIRSWSYLDILDMAYCENLKEFPHVPESITKLDLSGTGIEVSPSIKGISRLRRLVLDDCRKLVSIKQLPSCLKTLQANKCESLERLDCSFCNPNIRLSFVNCFKLDKKARDIIIHTPTQKVTIFPGEEVPTCFSDRATTGGFVTVKLNEVQLPISLRFKVCVQLNHGDDEIAAYSVFYHIMDKQNASHGSGSRLLYPLLLNHLYIFEIEAEKTANELVFKLEFGSDKWEIREYGILQL